jgi:DNA-directed RNA polymerase subunit M/transcription elongation factor TFIIS
MKTMRTLPIITCPTCGSHMSLSTVEPLQSRDKQTMTFACSCGFEYKQSSRVTEERTGGL